MKNTTRSNTEKIIEEATSVTEHEELETLIIASIETLKWQKMKCGIDEVLKLVQDSLKENISRESFDKILQSLIDSYFVKSNSISNTIFLSIPKNNTNRDAFNIKEELQFFKNELVKEFTCFTQAFFPEINSLKNQVLTPDARITNRSLTHSDISTSHISASRDQSPFNKIIQTDMFTNTINNEVKLRNLKDAFINELHGKITGIIKDQIKLQNSDQESTENSTAIQRKGTELLKNEIKKREDLIKTLSDTIKELTAAKSQPVTKPIPSFEDDSASNSNLNRPTFIEKFEPLSEHLAAQEVILNNVDLEEPPQSKNEKGSLEDQLEEVKKKKQEGFYVTKKGYSKDTSSSQNLYPRNTIVVAGDSIINGVFEDRLGKIMW